MGWIKNEDRYFKFISEMFGPLTESIVGKAVEKDILDIEVTNFRILLLINKIM